MNRPLRVFFLLVLLPGFAADAQQPRIRAALATQGDCWVGQRLTLVVELLVPGFFSGAPAFDLPDPQGLILVPPTQRPTLGTEVIDGTSYTVQRHELSVLARRGGAQTIPPLTVRFHFKRQPLDKDAVPATLSTAPLTFTARMPPGAEHLGSIISARDLTAVESWKPQPGKAKVGDAFTRTISFAAPDVPAMAFPPFPTPSVDGLGIYPKAPEVIDHDDRGQMRGERRDSVTYLCQRPGRFTVPPVRMSWFDIQSRKVRVIDFPARTFDVEPNPAMANPETAPSHVNLWPFVWALVTITSMAAIALLLKRWWARLVAPFRPVHLAPLNPSGPKEIG
ncbi:MAG TPA: hypothetical protein VH475_23455 [Tepidisphaeraceae bacterium]|jgi:hypothetical protein